MAERGAKLVVVVNDKGETAPVDTLPIPNGPRTTALMTGAGLASAFKKGSPSWQGLLAQVRKEMKAEGPASPDVMAEALRLSRRSSRRRDARATDFQAKCAKVLARHWPSLGTKREKTLVRQNEALVKAFGALVRRLGCDVIIDLNYDPTVEILLRAAEIPYVKATGSEVHWTGPLAAGAVLLWKIHGSLSAPSTIVLSPSEYQRMYEVNALGSELVELGKTIDALVTVGVGLQDDDVWAYLRGGTNQFAVVALLLTNKMKVPLPPTFREWWRLVSQTKAPGPLRVLRGDYTKAPLNVWLDELRTNILPAHRTASNGDVGLSSHVLRRISEFDRQYERLLASAPRASLLALVNDFKSDFEGLRVYLMSFGKRPGFGPRWCPDIVPHRRLGDVERRRLAEGLCEVVKRAIELCSHERQDATRYLVLAAAQAAIVYIVELSELLGLGPTVRLGNPASNLSLPAKSTFLVGSNPFFVRDPMQDNLLHRFHAPRKLLVKWPFTGVRQPATAKTRQAIPPELLSEDEWEAINIMVYNARQPQLTFSCSPGLPPLDLHGVPPLYPWGFRLLDVHGFREQSSGSVSRMWHLTASLLGDNQICKGGGLRDRGRKAFRLGGRGRIRVGEYDEFLEPAYRYEK